MLMEGSAAIRIAAGPEPSEPRMPLIKRPWTDQEIALAFAMRAAGKPLYLIANKVGRTKRAVQHILQSKRSTPPNVETDA
jgi:hypothetical protein